jgi:hypothetical protein
MSALGQKQTLERAPGMSALPPRADILRGGSDVRFVPKADIRISMTSCKQKAIVALQLSEPLLPGRFEPREQWPGRRSFIEVFSLRPSHRAATCPGSYPKLLQDWSCAAVVSARNNRARPVSRLALGVGTLMTVDGRTAHDVVMYWM